jgi:hypothetical protein
MSQTSYTQHASNENNIRFDGYDPKIAIKWVRETARTVTVKGENLIFCDIQTVCVNNEVFRCVVNNVKSGAESDPSALAYTTPVAVATPSLFKKYRTFKYCTWESLGLQESAEPENKLTKIARGRAEVTDKMRNDLEYLAIDLQLTPKNKRAIAEVSGDS